MLKNADDLLREFLNILRDNKGSDLHIQSEQIPKIRVQGLLKNLNYMALSHSQVNSIFNCLGPSNLEMGLYHDHFSTDFSFVDPVYGRFRVNVAKCSGGQKITMRDLNSPILPLNSLGFRENLFDPIKRMSQGLVIITGSTNSGKTTTLASLVMELADTQKNIITLENPIEYLFQHTYSQITQREYGRDFKTFERGIEDCLRQDPDVILVGELRNRETIRAALLLAETGHLVLTTLHSRSIGSVPDRIILPFEQGERNEIRTILDSSLSLIVAQQLVHNYSTHQLELKYDYKYFNSLEEIKYVK